MYYYYIDPKSKIHTKKENLSGLELNKKNNVSPKKDIKKLNKESKSFCQDKNNSTKFSSHNSSVENLITKVRCDTSQNNNEPKSGLYHLIKVFFLCKILKDEF